MTKGPLVVPPPSQGATNLAEMDIRGIRPPVEIPTIWLWIWTILGVLVAAGLGYVIYRWWKKRHAQNQQAVIIPPHRRAREKLKAAMELIGDPYPFCSVVSDTIRLYLEERFQLRAPERTTEEFIDELARSSLLTEEQKETLREFLAECDLVKFARHEPTRESLERLHGCAMTLIDETEPNALTAPSAEPGAKLEEKP